MKKILCVLVLLFLASSLSQARQLSHKNTVEKREVKLMGRIVKLNPSKCQSDLYRVPEQRIWRCKLKIDSNYDRSEALFAPNHFEEKYRCGQGKDCVVSAYIYANLVTISVRSLDWWKSSGSKNSLLKEDAVVGLTRFFHEYSGCHSCD